VRGHWEELGHGQQGSQLRKFQSKGSDAPKGLNYMDPNGGKIMCYFW